MKRRALLGTLASLAVAGCAETATEPSTTATTTTRTPTTTTATSTTQTTTTAAATPPELRTLGIPATQSSLPLGDDGRAVGYPGQSDAILSLTPADDELALPNDSTTFTLANDTDYEFHANFYGWTVSKREDGEWFRIAPQYWPVPLHMLPAGETHKWSFTVDNEQSPTGGAASDDNITLAGLGGGEYAFTVSGSFPLGEADTFPVALGARFELDGDPVELTPTDRVSASRDGDTVVVTTDEEPRENELPSAFVVERSGVPPERPVADRITEQLLRPEPGTSDEAPLRNTVSFFEEGVQTVRLEAPNGTHPPFGIDEPKYIRYEGETYKLSAKRLD